MKQDMIVILDLGGRNNTVIARTIRKLGVYSEIHPHDISLAKLSQLPNIKGIIINGGGNNLVDGVKIDVDHRIYTAGYPIMVVNHEPAEAKNKLPNWPESEEAIKEILHAFIFNVCQAEPNWNMKNFIENQVDLLKKQIGHKKVLLALSGGVDSSVVAALLIRAIGKQLVCVHVNHGLMRKGESEAILEIFKNQMQANLIYVDASKRFLSKLEKVSDPEQKRKIIGTEFIRVFEEEARKLEGIEFLAQGTIYPDIVESGTKTAGVVKSHHNVGGLPADLQFTLVEPLRHLFKDEVRLCGIELGLPASMVYRQPFPGPGLGVRCLGAITRERLEAVRESDAILQEEFEKLTQRYVSSQPKVYKEMQRILKNTDTDLRDIGITLAPDDDTFFSYTKIKDEYNILSPNDKLILMLLSCEANNRQLATFMNTTIDSIRVRKSQLKKKMSENNYDVSLFG